MRQKEVPEFLSWVHMLLEFGAKARRRIRDLVLSQLKDSEHKENSLMADLVMDDRFEFIGFAPNCMYIREDGEKTIWVHAFGSPQLLYKHKKSSSLVIMGPMIRFNDSVIGEISENNYNDMIKGITG